MIRAGGDTHSLTHSLTHSSLSACLPVFHTYIHTYIHAHIHACTHTNNQSKQTNAHTHTHTQYCAQVEVALDTMLSNGFRHLPVKNSRGHLVALLDVLQLTHAMFKSLNQRTNQKARQTLSANSKASKLPMPIKSSKPGVCLCVCVCVCGRYVHAWIDK